MHCPLRDWFARRVSIGEIESRNERLVLRVALNNRQMPVDDRRTAKAPVKVRTRAPTTVEDAQILFPQKFSGEIEAIEAF